MQNSLVVIAHNIRSLHNVGAIFRTSEGAGVNKIYLTGYTGIPPRKEISKVALGSEERIPWEQSKNISHLITKLKSEGYQLVSLEQDPRSTDYKAFKPNPKTALLIGNEVRGVSKQLRDKSDSIIELPMHGKRKSLNVSVAFGIAIYELSSKLK
ncbi:MAG: RNA methyltransferase [Patescibacteria group bacterium]